MMSLVRDREKVCTDHRHMILRTTRTHTHMHAHTHTGLSKLVNLSQNVVTFVPTQYGGMVVNYKEWWCRSDIKR